MLLKISKKILYKKINKTYKEIIDAIYGEHRDAMIVVLNKDVETLKAEENRKDFSLRYVTNFKVSDNCIENLRKDIGYRCMMYQKSKPKVVILIPTLSALKMLGIKKSYNLLFGNSWKGSSVDPMDRLIAEYKVIL